jgi:hypothetical protein
MFEYILKYLKNNNNKRLLVYYLENYSYNNIRDLALFLNKNGIEVDKINKCLRFNNNFKCVNSNEILIAGNIEHLRGYKIDDFIFFGYYDNLDNIQFIKNNIIFGNMNSRNYYSKNIILEKYFKNN